MKIAFATSNVAKIKLASERLRKYGVSIVPLKIEKIEPQLFDVEEVATSKARQIINRVKMPFLVEDSGLYIKMLQGFPGALVKPVISAIGDKGLLKLMDLKKDRTAEVRSVLVFGDPRKKEVKSFIGIYSGRLSFKPEGGNLRGWEVARIFVPKGANKTIASLNESEWHKLFRVFMKSDPYEKFGKWIQKNSKS